MSPSLSLASVSVTKLIIFCGVVHLVVGVLPACSGPCMDCWTSDRLLWLDSPRNIRCVPRMNRFQPSFIWPVCGMMSMTCGSISILAANCGIACGRSAMVGGWIGWLRSSL